MYVKLVILLHLCAYYHEASIMINSKSLLPSSTLEGEKKKISTAPVRLLFRRKYNESFYLQIGTRAWVQTIPVYVLKEANLLPIGFCIFHHAWFPALSLNQHRQIVCNYLLHYSCCFLIPSWITDLRQQPEELII